MTAGEGLQTIQSALGVEGLGIQGQRSKCRVSAGTAVIALFGVTRVRRAIGAGKEFRRA